MRSFKLTTCHSSAPFSLSPHSMQSKECNLRAYLFATAAMPAHKSLVAYAIRELEAIPKAAQRPERGLKKMQNADQRPAQHATVSRYPQAANGQAL